MDNHDQSTLVQAHQPCPDCGSSDALSVYSDGHTFCFACSKHTQGAKPSSVRPEVRAQVTNLGALRTGEIRELKSRGLSLDTCKAFGHAVSDGVQVYPYVDANGTVVAQKLRTKDKQFGWVGQSSGVQLYGYQLWKGCDPRIVVVTEGENDAESIYEVTRGQMPVVSLQNGAQSAVKSFKQAYDWLETFDSVVLCFDNDEPGLKAAKEAAQMLSPGKAKIAALPLKDANDMLKEGRTSELYTALKHAKAWSPAGIVSGEDIGARARADRPKPFASFPWEFLNKAVGGIYVGDVITVGAGSGVGKTTFMAEIAHHLAMSGIGVGLMFMEENLEETALRFHGIHLNRSLFNGRDEASNEELVEAAKATTDNGLFHLYEHQGESDMNVTLAAMRHLIKVNGVKVLFLDNLSTIVAGLDDENERRAIDKLVRGLVDFAKREKVAVFLASHLSNPMGAKGYENGLEINQKSFRGSGAICSNAWLTLGLERDIYGDAPTAIRVVKSRRFGANAGIRGYLNLEGPTGRMREASEVSPFAPVSKSKTHNTDF